MIDRGYHMAWIWEISLPALKDFSQESKHKKWNFVSPSGHVIFYLLYKHQWNTYEGTAIKDTALKRPNYFM